MSHQAFYLILSTIASRHVLNELVKERYYTG